ncbi:MAG: hypothetical protein ABUL50_13085 [Rhizobacter sp.]
MTSIAWQITWRLALCVAVSWLAWRVGSSLWGRAGLVPMVCTAPLYGILLAKPLLGLLSELGYWGRVATWHDVEGRYFEYRGRPVRGIEDVEHARWVRAADVRAIVGFTASDGTLALTYPTGWAQFGSPSEPYFSAEVLLTHLRKENAAEAGRFALWVERTVAFPARRVRERQR